MSSPSDAVDKPAAAPVQGGWWLAFLLSITVSLLIVAPFFWRGVASGHDFEFHTTSWLDVAGQWKEGILYPRWTEWANHGFGEPRFIFYPPLSWLLAPALSLFLPWDYVPVAFIVLVQTFAGFSAFAFARRMLPRSSALFAAACYAANPNALLMIYFRSDYAELLASAFFPLLFLTTLQLAGILESDPRRRRHTLVAFSAALAVVWLSNAPAGVMATYSVTFLFAWAGLMRKSWSPVFRAAAGLPLAFGLAAFYLVPAAYEQRWVNIAQALSPGLLPSENFLFTTANDPEHTFFNYIASTIAVVIIVFTGVAAIAIHKQVNQFDPTQQREHLWRTFLVLSAIATALMFRPASIVWQLLPKLRFVQFPWRWMSILTVPFIYFLAAAFARRQFRWLVLLFTAAFLLGTAIFLVQHTWWDDEEFSTLRAAIASGQGFDGADEYDPVGDDHYNLPKDAPGIQLLLPVDDNDTTRNPGKPIDAKVFNERWTAQEKIVRTDSSQPLRVAIRLLNYPAWRVEVNGSRIAPESAEDSGQMIVPVPAGQSRIHIGFTRTPDRALGIAISAASLIAALFFLWGERRQQQSLSA